jgi:hypothetical protein
MTLIQIRFTFQMINSVLHEPKEMTYDEKLQQANDYLGSVCGIQWNDLSDINSLHDVDTPEEIIELCNNRLREDGLNVEDE